jgi:tetratricopeptide (TPR) repeat protein
MVSVKTIIIFILLLPITVFATDTGKQIRALLNEADGLINDYPEKADSVINIAWQLIKTDSISEYVAHYNIITGYVNLSNENIYKINDAITLAKEYFIKNEDPFRIAQIDLLNGLFLEQLNFYKDAYKEFSKAYDYFKNTSHHNLTLKTLWGMYRISDNIKEDGTPFIKKADSLFNNYPNEINKGLYWKDKAKIVSDNKFKVQYYLKAARYYKKNSQRNNYIIILEYLTNHYLNIDQLDSAENYLSKIQYITNTDSPIFPPIRIASIYFLTGKLLYKQKNYIEAKQYLDLAIKQAKASDLNNIPLIAWELQLRIDTITHNYKKALKSYAGFYQSSRRQTLTMHKNQYYTIIENEGIINATIDNKQLQLEVSEARLSRFIILLGASVIVNILAVLVFIVLRYKKKEKEKRIIAEQKTAEKEITLNEKQTILQNIKNKIESTTIDPLKKIDIIEKNLENPHTNLDWTTVFNLFELKNPQARTTINKKFPGLSDLEYQYLVLILCSYTTVQITTIMNVQPQTVTKRAYRLKKKYNIPKDIRLKEYLIQVVNLG